MKTILPWRNDADGFAFDNTWTFDATERAALSGLTSPAVAGAVGALASVIPDPGFLLSAVAVAEAAVALGPLPTYGLCGGMSYSAADHWIAKAALPRGPNQATHPVRTSTLGNAVRSMIWGRLIDSLGSGGALQRTLEWSLLLNQVPGNLGGGAGALLNRTKPEWVLAKSKIDSGTVCPIGLVYKGADVWNQHQVLVYGYEDNNDGKGKLFVYDCNAPHQFGQTGDDVITLDFTGSALVATTPSDGVGVALAGFFCTKYTPVAPPTGLATSFGQFLSWFRDPHSWFVGYGARMPVSGAVELAALGATSASVLATGSTFGSTLTRPRDGALLREHSSAPVFLYQGGAPFFIPNPTVLNSFGGFGAVRVVPDNTIMVFALPPDEGTLLREISAAKVFRILSGQKHWVTTPAELANYGGFGMVRIVPDGALASIPEGTVLPAPAPNECATLAAQVQSFNTDIGRLNDALGDAPTVRDQARIKAAILRDQSSLAAVQARRSVLQCP